MKRNLHTIRLMLLTLFAAFTLQQGYSQAVFIENFDYSTGDLPLNPASVWSSANTGTAIQVVSGSLTYSSYALSGIANSITMRTGLDYNASIGTINSGAVYGAFMVNVTTPTTGGDYFLHFTETSTYFKGRVWIKQGSAAGKFIVGIAKNGTTPPVAYTTAEYDVNQTHLLVLKYQFNTGSTTDDVVSVFINPVIGSDEPAAADITAADNTTNDASYLSLIGLRQGGSSSGPTLTVDGIRVATSWAEAVNAALPADETAPVATFDPANAATDIAINVSPTITFDEAVLKTDGSELTDADLASLITFKKTDAAGENVAFTATIDAAKKVITVDPAADLDNAQAYYLAVGPVEDAAGNESTLASATFTTIAATTPTITITAPVGGEVYYAGQSSVVTWTSSNITNVRVDVWVAGATEWQPFVATTPAAAGTVDIVVPADAGYGTTYKLRVADVDNPTTAFSESGEFTVIGVATSLADLRERFASGDKVRLTGEVTVTFLRPNNRHQKYVQDAGAGLLIDDNAGTLQTTLNVGDNITGLEGTLGLYGGMLQIVPSVTSVTVASTGNTVTVPEMTITEYKAAYQQYESMLIELLNVAVSEADGTATFAASTNYTLADAVTTVVLRTFYAGDGDVVGSVIPRSRMNITVIAGFFNTTVQTYLRNMSDMQLLSSDKSITSFAFNGLTPAATGTIDQNARTIAVSVPAGTDRTALVPTIAVSDKATVSPVSGVAQNFTSDVVYTVTAEDGTTATYTVTVSFATGIDHKIAGKLVIYPVPATTEISARNIEDVTLMEIFDITGKKRMTQKCEGEYEVTIPVSQLSRGVYFIKFTTPAGTVMKRFVKE